MIRLFRCKINLYIVPGRQMIVSVTSMFRLEPVRFSVFLKITIFLACLGKSFFRDVLDT